MSELITIEKEKLNDLRRSLNEALKFIEGLGVREQETPEPSKRKQRINKYLKKL